MFPASNSPIFPSSALLTLSSILLSGVITLPLFAETDPPSDDGTRPAIDANAPYIISPRNSATRNLAPRFQWAQVDGIESYTVSLTSVDRGMFWVKEIAGIETIYDGDPLQPETDYILSVTARSDNAARADNIQTTTFYIISDAERAVIEAELHRLEAIADPNDRGALLESQVELLSSKYLMSDAIDLLDAELVDNPDSLDAVCLLDDLFEQANDAMLNAIGLRESFVQYREARNLGSCEP